MTAPVAHRESVPGHLLVGTPLLKVRDLTVTFASRGRRPVRAVDGIDLDVAAGSTVGIVGESGSGKSVTSLAAMGLLGKRGVTVTGSVEFDGEDLLNMPEDELRSVRGREIAMIFQDPMSSLNPVLTVGRQITEILERHKGLKGQAAKDRAAELLASVGIGDSVRRLRSFPHQLSGGMRQRVMIAMALACEPRLLIADEPTTALDVTISAQILELLRVLVKDTGTALILITHDLGVVAGLCDQVHVMYSGRIVESAPRRPLFAEPQHPYTTGLLASVPRLDQPRGLPLLPIPGSPSDTLPWAQGCAFSPRCTRRVDACVGHPPVIGPAPSRVPGHLVRCVNPVPYDVEEPTP
ncbi:MAG: oligopeptide/dipeptide transporter, ATPase subunit [Frankiales bacterium]|nr:oligopeptide/dipeptide transporter, ATPase subunit [Frankiales bacterium]